MGALNLPKMCDVELDLLPLNSRQGPGGGGGVGSGGGGPPGGWGALVVKRTSSAVETLQR